MAKVKAGPRFTAHEIIKGRLYQRGMMHRHPAAGRREALEAFGIRIVVALAPAEPDPGLEQLAAAGAIEYILAPIPDGKLHADTAAGLQMLASAVARLSAQEGWPVLTHCRAGRNRSGLFSALLVREWMGISGLEAIGVVQRQRPRALANEEFVKFLETLPPISPLEPRAAEPPPPAKRQVRKIEQLEMFSL